MGLLFASLLASAGAAALERPALMESQAGCELWLGDASGNDPTVRLQMQLCPDGDALRGEVQWSSLQSGWSVRAVSGRREGDSVELRDDRIVEERPEPGWVFCTVDRWSLVRRGDRMEGTYASATCRDSASVRLTLMVDTAGQGTVPPGPPATPLPSTPPATPLPSNAACDTSAEHAACDTTEPARRSLDVRVRMLDGNPWRFGRLARWRGRACDRAAAADAVNVYRRRS